MNKGEVIGAFHLHLNFITGNDITFRTIIFFSWKSKRDVPIAVVSVVDARCESRSIHRLEKRIDTI